MWDHMGTAGVCQFKVSETKESAAGPLSVSIVRKMEISKISICKV